MLFLYREIHLGFGQSGPGETVTTLHDNPRGTPPEDSPMDRSRRRFGIGLALAAQVAVVGLELWQPWKKSHDVERDSHDSIDRLLGGKHVEMTPPKGGLNDEFLQKWERRYLGQDHAYEKSRIKYRKNKKTGKVIPMIPKTRHQELLEGWQRITQDRNLDMIYEKSRKYKVPFEVVFLALGESAWNCDAVSPAKAGGCWQFIPKTARRMGLMRAGYDGRGDPESSTDMAFKLLRENYQATHNWDRSAKFSATEISKISEHDRWAWAWWTYNRGTSTRNEYIKFRGQSRKYVEFRMAVAEQYRGTKKYGRMIESPNYVAKAFGIGAALRKMYQSGALGKSATTVPVAGPEQVEPAPAEDMTTADRAYEQYKQEVRRLAPREHVARLEELIQMFPDDDDMVQMFQDKIEDIRERYKDQFQISESDDRQETHAAAIVDHGRIDIRVENKDRQPVFAEAVPYEIQRRDTVTGMAKRLAGHPNKEQLVIHLIRKLNPQLKGNLNDIEAGDEIDVPGEYVEITSGMTLSGLAKKYHPGRLPEEGMNYLRFLNDLHSDQLRVGDVILVPAIR